MPRSNHTAAAASSQDEVPVLEVVEEKESRSRRRRRRFECNRCGSTYPPITKSEISQNGWILFIVLLVVFWPLCFIGLFQKESYQACVDCGTRVRRRRSTSFTL